MSEMNDLESHIISPHKCIYSLEAEYKIIVSLLSKYRSLCEKENSNCNKQQRDASAKYRSIPLSIRIFNTMHKIAS